MPAPVGSYVRFTTNEMYDGVCDTFLHVVGFPTAANAEAAVKKYRLKAGKTYEVLPKAATLGQGPQPAPGQVWLLRGVM